VTTENPEYGEAVQPYSVPRQISIEEEETASVGLGETAA